MVKVVVSHHATQRLRERAGIRDSVLLIEREVAEAIEAGRTSARMPQQISGLHGRGERGSAGRGRIRWVWHEDRSRTYLVRRRREVIVITVIPSEALDLEAVSA